ncbi:MAG: DUF3095 domain-containing protein [Bacteroidota bacterium]|nr:DUF3095 domain-containing protein [Bacteroidota bacterium]
MNTESFFLDLPIIENFVDISNPRVYTPLPEDWHIAVSDVKDSTGLIRRGRYKEVNLLGASSIIALLNLKKSFSLPFIFGGDGATLCIPPSLLEQARQSLVATKMMAHEAYGIELRVGIVPLKHVRKHGFDVLVARCRISENFTQAVFSGGGLQFAEECVKNPVTEQQFGLSTNDAEPVADFTGLECRWKNVPSARGEIVTLIVQAIGKSDKKKNETYREVIRKIGEIYGTDVLCRPVREEDLSMSFSEKQLYGESRIRSYRKGKLYRIYYWLKIRYQVLAGKFALLVKYKSRSVDFGKYKSELAANTDFKKFDDKLRQVLSGTPEQRAELTSYLEKKFHDRDLVYGIQVAPTAIITCLIFSYNGAHIHLVDSDNGGYAIAAAQLKEQLKSLSTSSNGGD